MGEKEGEKNGGDKKVAPAPEDDVSVTAVYKIDCNCEGCADKIKKALRHFDGVEEVKRDCGANKLTVKGTNVDPTAIREKLEKEIKKKFELVSPQPKKDGGSGGYKKPEEKKAEKKEEPKKPKELRDELHKETLQLARENLENEPPIMELRNQKEGEKNGGDNKVVLAPAPVEKKDNVSVTAVYKIDCNCEGCAKKVKKAVCYFDGVEEVKIDCGANKLTVKGTNLDPMAIREKLEKEIKKKFELVSPQPKKDGGSGSYKKPEEKKAEKKEEPKKPKELRDELYKETPQLVRENLENEPPIMELRKQCRIIQTTELAAAQEKLNELERKKESLLQRLQDVMNKTEEESENLHKQLLGRDVDLGTFVQKYKKLRTTYHWHALIHLSAKTSSIG